MLHFRQKLVLLSLPFTRLCEDKSLDICQLECFGVGHEGEKRPSLTKNFVNSVRAVKL